MTDHLFPAKQRLILNRWCALAEQRLAYLAELYDSGRWHRFHSQAEFLDNVREAREAVLTWRGLLAGLEGNAAGADVVVPKTSAVGTSDEAPAFDFALAAWQRAASEHAQQDVETLQRDQRLPNLRYSV